MLPAHQRFLSSLEEACEFVDAPKGAVSGQASLQATLQVEEITVPLPMDQETHKRLLHTSATVLEEGQALQMGRQQCMLSVEKFEEILLAVRGQLCLPGKLSVGWPVVVLHTPGAEEIPWPKEEEDFAVALAVWLPSVYVGHTVAVDCLEDPATLEQPRRSSMEPAILGEFYSATVASAAKLKKDSQLRYTAWLNGEEPKRMGIIEQGVCTVAYFHIRTSGPEITGETLRRPELLFADILAPLAQVPYTFVFYYHQWKVGRERIVAMMRKAVALIGDRNVEDTSKKSAMQEYGDCSTWHFRSALFSVVDGITLALENESSEGDLPQTVPLPQGPYRLDTVVSTAFYSKPTPGILVSSPLAWTHLHFDRRNAMRELRKVLATSAEHTTSVEEYVELLANDIRLLPLVWANKRLEDGLEELSELAKRDFALYCKIAQAYFAEANEREAKGGFLLTLLMEHGWMPELDVKEVDGEWRLSKEDTKLLLELLEKSSGVLSACNALQRRCSPLLMNCALPHVPLTIERLRGLVEHYELAEYEAPLAARIGSVRPSSCLFLLLDLIHPNLSPILYERVVVPLLEVAKEHYLQAGYETVSLIENHLLVFANWNDMEGFDLVLRKVTVVPATRLIEKGEEVFGGGLRGATWTALDVQMWTIRMLRYCIPYVLGNLRVQMQFLTERKNSVRADSSLADALDVCWPAANLGERLTTFLQRDDTRLVMECGPPVAWKHLRSIKSSKSFVIVDVKEREGGGVAVTVRKEVSGSRKTHMMRLRTQISGLESKLATLPAVSKSAIE